MPTDATTSPNPSGAPAKKKPGKSVMKERLLVSMHPDMHGGLMDLSEKRGLSMAALVREAVQRHFGLKVPTHY